MTLSIELLPAPLGPMIARTSCSRTSKLMSVSALTPPNDNVMLSSLRTTSPNPRSLISRSRLRRASLRRREGLGVFDPQVGRHHVRAAVLEADHRLDVLHVPV